MNKSNVKGERIVGLFLLGLLLFNYPVFALFNSSTMVFGVPVLYAYTFGAWALFIVLLAWVIEKR